MLGLPFSFAYHFAPDLLDQALSLYRSTFQPSTLLRLPQVMVAVSVLCAPTTEEARYLSGSSALTVLQRRSGNLGLLPSPEEAAQYPFSDQGGLVNQALASHIIGDPDAVRDGLLGLQQRTDADEIMLSTRAHSLDVRQRSMRLIAESWGLTPPTP